MFAPLRGVIVLVGVLLSFAMAAYAQNTQTVVAKPGSVSWTNGGFTAPSDADSSSASSITVVGNTVEIVSKIFTPPSGLLFAEFGGQGTYVDVIRNPDGLPPLRPMPYDNNLQIQLRDRYTAVTAATFPLYAQGNLGGNGGIGGGENGFHWSARVSDAGSYPGLLVAQDKCYGTIATDTPDTDIVTDSPTLYCGISDEAGNGMAQFWLVPDQNETRSFDWEVTSTDGVTSYGDGRLSSYNIYQSECGGLAPGIYLLNVGPVGGNPLYSIIIVVAPVQINVDVNNNGTISTDEQACKAIAPGKVIRVDQAADGGDAQIEGDIANIQINATQGIVKLSSANDKVRFWTNANRTERIMSGTTWDLSETTVPASIWFESNDEGDGQDMITLEYTNQGKTFTDSAYVYVGKTVSYVPLGKQAALWGPFGYSENKDHDMYLKPGVLGVVANCHLSSMAWDVRKYIDDELDTTAAASLAKFKSLPLTAGVIILHTHGGRSADKTKYMIDVAMFSSHASAALWMGNESDMYIADHSDGTAAVVAKPEWFRNNWKGANDCNKAIVIALGCYTAEDGSVLEDMGGRVRIGTVGIGNSDDDATNMNLFLGSMGKGGNLSYGKTPCSFATAGKAYSDNSASYLPLGSLKFQDGPYGNEWTTLGPSVEAYFPLGAVNTVDKRAGCAIFNSYVCYGDGAQACVSGETVTLTDPHWFGADCYQNQRKYGIGFWVQKTNKTDQSIIKMEKAKCKSYSNGDIQMSDEKDQNIPYSWRF